MRLAGQLKGGFFPAPPEAVALALDRLNVPRNRKPLIFDPCCGRGAAIKQLADGLGIIPSDVYANELSPDLGQEAIDAMPGSNVIANSDFLSLSCAMKVFSFMWCNPPFDTTIESGGRVEFKFLVRAHDLLVDGGIMAFVIPEPVASRSDVMRFMTSRYTRLSRFEYPEGHRHFREIVIMGEKLPKPDDDYRASWNGHIVPGKVINYDLPDGRKPYRFKKTVLAEHEIDAELRRSSISRLLKFKPPPPIASPPLSLGDGHIALLVAAGQLDGLIEPANEPPHVVRGTAKKVEYVDTVETSEDEDGKCKTTTIMKQRIVITVRAIDQLGEIKTFTDQREGDSDVGAEANENDDSTEDNNAGNGRTGSSPND